MYLVIADISWNGFGSHLFFHFWQSLRYFKRTVGAWFLVYGKIFIAISSCSVHPNVMVQHDNTKMSFDKKMYGDNIQSNSWLKFCNLTPFVMIGGGIFLNTVVMSRDLDQSWANIYGRSVGGLENTIMSMQPTCNLYWKESK